MGVVAVISLPNSDSNEVRLKRDRPKRGCVWVAYRGRMTTDRRLDAAIQKASPAGGGDTATAFAEMAAVIRDLLDDVETLKTDVENLKRSQ